MVEAAPSSPETTKDDKPKRNPVERVVVWALILVGVVIVCTEGSARIGYTMSLNKLQNRVHDDEGEEANPLTLTEAEKMMVGFPTREPGNERITFRYRGLVKEFGAIHLYHDDEDLVLHYETDAPPEIEEPEEGEISDEGLSDENSAGDGIGSSSEGYNGESGMGGGGPAAGGGGRRNFDPMQFDEDKDGKVSLDEAPDRLKERFNEIDTNEDGFLDADEFAARRAAREQGRMNESSSGSRPQRPTAEEGESEPAKDVLESIEKTE